MTFNNNLQGGCFCGEIRYIIKGTEFDSDYCHCSQCRLTVGAVVVCWMDFKIEQINWLNNKPKEYVSSDKVRRGFCEHCGCSISFRHVDYPDYQSLTNATLDNPDMVPPRYHIYSDDQVEWLNIDDACKRYPKKRK
jgi:hypothetical protein